MWEVSYGPHPLCPDSHPLQAKLESRPEVLLSTYKAGEPLVMELSLDVFPEVTFSSSYKGLKVSGSGRWLSP
jgi:FKBP-type peptidyl-prolyl cis-trans isomerase (trigger factor)